MTFEEFEEIVLTKFPAAQCRDEITEYIAEIVGKYPIEISHDFTEDSWSADTTSVEEAYIGELDYLYADSFEELLDQLDQRAKDLFDWAMYIKQLVEST
jgi:enolase